MTLWIIIGTVDALTLGLFGWFGGISAAGQAIQRWGEIAAARPRP